MLTFPLQAGASLVVIEPGNIQRLREGRPLRVGDTLIAFTPDMQEFVKRIGVTDPLPKQGEKISCAIELSAEEIESALKYCRRFPEVIR